MEAPIKINKDLPLIAQNHGEESQSEGQAEVRSLRAQVVLRREIHPSVTSEGLMARVVCPDSGGTTLLIIL